MMRPVIVLILLLSTAVMMRGVASDWRQGPPVPAEVPAKKGAAATPEAVAPLPQLKALQPVVPGDLPDLRDGYLFNQERALAGAEPPPSEEGTVDQEANPLGIEASIDEVIYTGSIITEATSRALIVYPAAAKAKAKTAPPLPQASRSSRSKPPPAVSSSEGEEHARLEVGDVLDGYEVAEILPDKLIFTKGEETVEKLLHDPEKKRLAPPPRPAGPAPGTPRPPQAAGVPGSPGGIQSTTIGGPAVPTSAPATPGRPGQPGQPGLSTPSVPGAPPAITRPSMPAGSPAAKGSQPSPVRRMVISRQPAPGPNTSRVLRQSPDAEGVIPSPPGMTPGVDPSVPPMPGATPEEQ